MTGMSQANSRRKNNARRKAKRSMCWARGEERRARNKKVLMGHRRPGTYKSKQKAA